MTDTCRREIERRRTAQPARTDNDNLRRKQRVLSCAANLLKNKVAGLPFDLIRSHEG